MDKIMKIWNRLRKVNAIFNKAEKQNAYFENAQNAIWLFNMQNNYLDF